MVAGAVREGIGREGRAIRSTFTAPTKTLDFILTWVIIGWLNRAMECSDLQIIKTFLATVMDRKCGRQECEHREAYQRVCQ